MDNYNRSQSQKDRSDVTVRVTGLVSTAHFFSHFYFMVLPPLFPLLRESLDTTYTQLGVLIIIFNVVSASLQLPTGIVVDRLDPPRLLIGAVALQGIALLCIGLAPYYWVMVIAMAAAGAANAVYHPADYAILNRAVSEKGMGRAFSVHTVSGFSGSAVAPATIVLLSQLGGWQLAVIAAGVLGLSIALFLLLQLHVLEKHSETTPKSTTKELQVSDWRKVAKLLFSPPILLAFVFWVFIALAHSGVAYFSVSALDRLFNISLTVSNGALTGFLLGSSVGILLGGVIGDKTHRHVLVIVLGCTVSGLLIISIGTINMPIMVLAITMTIAGIASGVIAPSRDLLVRSLTPEGSMGTVFGFVSTGLNVGGIIGPLIFGWLLDNGRAGDVFLVAGGFMLAITLTVGGMQVAKNSQLYARKTFEEPPAT